MMLWFRRWAPVLSLAAVSALALSQERPPRPPVPAEEQDVTLPSGKSQRDEILKAEHEQNLKDAAQLVEMAEQLKAELEKNDRFVLSLATIKKTDDIEKLVKKIRSRLRH
ncbi:MAG: hypothetical protein LAP87_28415 [Acidobacteriia bacterium]|nr:hypothetical protein [Terriglobia bacterium]